MYRSSIIIIGFAGIIILSTMYFWINYNDLSWKENSSSYIGIISALSLIASIISFERDENKKYKTNNIDRN